jgi:hypothetical protein
MNTDALRSELHAIEAKLSGGNFYEVLGVAEGSTELLLVGSAEVKVVLGQERADEREPVRMEAARGDPHDRVARSSGGSVEQPLALDTMRHQLDTGIQEMQHIAHATMSCVPARPAPSSCCSVGAAKRTARR